MTNSTRCGCDDVAVGAAVAAGSSRTTASVAAVDAVAGDGDDDEAARCFFEDSTFFAIGKNPSGEEKSYVRSIRGSSVD